MKWWKRYAFLLMIVITGIGYGAGKMVKAVAGYQERQAAAVENGVGGVISQRVKSEMESWQGQEPGDQRLQEDENQSPQGDGSDEQQGQGVDTAGQPGQAAGNGSGGKKEFLRVDMDYLSDALFIGDSRTSTLYEYAGWDQTDFFVKYGLTIWDVWDQKMDGRTLSDVLGAKKYGKIYIMLGINELGNETAEKFREQFASVLAQIQEMQPDAIIFLEAIIHVTAKKDAQGTYINNAEVNARNQEIQKLADQERIFWLDPNEVMDAPGSGVLNGEYSNDGVHLKVKYISVWREFLLDHGIIKY